MHPFIWTAARNFWTLKNGLFDWAKNPRKSCRKFECDAPQQNLRMKRVFACKRTHSQCCQMVYFQTKNSNLGKYGKALQWKMLEFL
jgi:hypothetical protein